MTWTNKRWKFGETPDDVDMNAMQADITAKANGDTGATKNSNASMDANSVDTSQLVAASVMQSKLKTAQGSVSHTYVDGSGNDVANRTLPGGEYGFHTQIRSASSLVADYHVYYNTTATSYFTGVAIIRQSQPPASTRTAYVQQRYIQSSPPYDLGDGECGLFIFCLIKKGSGQIVSLYVAPDAPWNLNGPTDIRESKNKLVLVTDEYDYRDLYAAAIDARQVLREDGEPTPLQIEALRRWMDLAPSVRKLSVNESVPQSVKNADMALIPHPFGLVDSEHEVVLLDPVNDLSHQLNDIWQRQIEPVDQLLMEGFFKIGNSEISRVSPPGVKTVGYRWR